MWVKAFDGVLTSCLHFLERKFLGQSIGNPASKNMVALQPDRHRSQIF